jgi:hypothetical protein
MANASDDDLLVEVPVEELFKGRQWKMLLQFQWLPERLRIKSINL